MIVEVLKCAWTQSKHCQRMAAISSAQDKGRGKNVLRRVSFAERNGHVFRLRTGR